jgi:hypothetical protein
MRSDRLFQDIPRLYHAVFEESTHTATILNNVLDTIDRFALLEQHD